MCSWLAHLFEGRSEAGMYEATQFISLHVPAWALSYSTETLAQVALGSGWLLVSAACPWHPDWEVDSMEQLSWLYGLFSARPLLFLQAFYTTNVSTES